MFRKVNPYLRDELSVEAVAHKCGCRCNEKSETVGDVIQIRLNNSTCTASCIGSNNYTANYSLSKSNKNQSKQFWCR